MDEQNPCSVPDPLLLPFLQAADEAAAQQHLESLLQMCALPRLRRLFRRMLGVSSSPAGACVPQPEEDPEVEDLCGEALSRLMVRLQQGRTDPCVPPIHNFLAYVVVTGDHVCDGYLRHKYPRRRHFKDRLYYLLSERTGQRGLARWQSAQGEWLCGFALWRDQGKDWHSSERYLLLCADPQAFASTPAYSLHVDKSLPTLLGALFDWVGHPLPFDDLVRIVVDLCEIQEDGTAPGSADGDGAVDPVEYGVRVESDVVTEVAHRLFLQRVWNEVCQLPSAQCAALLLNLRDAQERGVLALIPLTDVAPFRQIAEALGMAAEDLTVLWKDLPLDDATIAERLGLERQQVINLRKAARARLARRLRGFSP